MKDTLTLRRGFPECAVANDLVFRPESLAGRGNNARALIRRSIDGQCGQREAQKLNSTEDGTETTKGLGHFAVAVQFVEEWRVAVAAQRVHVTFRSDDALHEKGGYGR